MWTLTYREPRLLVLVVGLVVATGLAALATIGRQEDPTITNLFATVITPFAGADPARVEALVTEPIETELRDIAEIDTIASASRRGLSVITVELGDHLADAAIPAVWSQIRDALDDAARTLPAAVPDPVFDNDRTGAYTLIYAVRARTGLDASPGLLRRHAELLQDRLRAVPETHQVDLFGAAREEILVAVDPRRLAQFGLTAADVAGAIRAGDAKRAAGTVHGAEARLLVEVAGEIADPERVRTVPLVTDETGTTVRVGDVAEVRRAVATPRPSLALADGRPAVLVAARMEDDRQVDRWTARAKAAVAELEATMPAGLEAALLFDQSRYTAARFVELGRNMALGVAIVLAVLLVTLGWRSALVVALVLPLSALLSIAAMQRLGVPLQQMSVTGLIVALGLLVDAAIVMTDEIRRRVLAGIGREAAVSASVRRLAVPLLASTVTTVLAFMPMALLPGPAGDFVGSIATAVIIMLTASLALALVVTPALAGRLMPADPSRGFWGGGVDPGALGRLFARLVRAGIARPVAGIAVALVLPAMGFLAFPTLTAQFFPGVERDQFHVQLRLANAAPIEATRRTAEAIGAVMRAQPEIARVHWVVGESAPAFYYNMRRDQDGVARYAEALVTTTSPDDTRAVIPRLQASLDRRFPDAQVLVRDLKQGPPVSAPVELRLYGPDLATLDRAGEELRGLMAEVPAITHTRASLAGAAPQLRLEVDETAVDLLGLELADVAAQLDAALEGAIGGSLIEGSEALDVRVRLDGAERAAAQALAGLVLVPPGADPAGAYPGVPASAVATLRLVPGEPVITRRNGERVNTVQGFVHLGVLPEEALAAVRERVTAAGWRPPAGYRLAVGGDSDARGDTVRNLASSLGLIAALTVATIVLTFRSYRLSLIAAAVALLSVGLAVLALAVCRYPFGIQALIGVIGSIGVSLNAAIIVLTGLRDTPAARAGDRDAMAEVVLHSSRHIWSTTLTTCGGFLPLILAGGGFWPPFAMAIAGGVLLAVVPAFAFTPAMFALVYARRPRRTAAAPLRHATPARAA